MVKLQWQKYNSKITIINNTNITTVKLHQQNYNSEFTTINNNIATVQLQQSQQLYNYNCKLTAA